MPRLRAAELAEYLLDLGGALLSYGCPTYRLEAVIREIAQQEGFRADAFAVPTGLWMSLRPDDDSEPPVVRMVRVKDWAVNLERLVLVDEIFNDVLARRMTLAEARRKLDQVEARRPPYPLALRWLAAALAAGAAAVFFRGGFREVAIGALGGALTGILGTLLAAQPRTRLLSDFVGGLLAAGLAWVATLIDPRLSREVVVLSTIIGLVPGMALTTGLSELANKNLVSGASRLMEAFMVFLSILFGIAVVIGVEQTTGLRPGPAPAREGLAWPLHAAALLLAGAGFCVLFAVPRRHLVLGIGSGAIAWVATAFGTRYLPGALPAFGAALSVCLYANVMARVTQRPAQAFLLPGLVLLVPGSFGFLSLEAFLRGEFLGGAAKAFEMFLIAGAIVMGLLVAHVLVPARKLL